jgi:integrase
MRHWLDCLKHSIAATTYDGYNVVLKAHILPYFEPKRLKVKDLTPAHIQQYIDFKMASISPNTIIKHLMNISKCLDSALRQNLLAYNPVKRIDMPKKIRYTGAKHYKEKHIEQLLECSKSDPLKIVILLTVFYGLRRSEVLGLKWNAIDMENNAISIRHTVTEAFNVIRKSDDTKNDSSCAVIPLPDIIKNELLKWRAEQQYHKSLQPTDYNDEGYVCTHIDGRLIRPNYVTQHFKILLNKHNMPIIRFHDLRHSAAHFLKYLDFDLKDIQTWLRHADIQTTMNIYVNLDMEAKQDIANKLNDRFIKFAI